MQAPEHNHPLGACQDAEGLISTARQALIYASTLEGGEANADRGDGVGKRGAAAAGEGVQAVTRHGDGF